MIPLTLDKLADWKFDGTALAVLGHPVAHSVSPQMHRAALLGMSQTQQLFSRWDYFMLDVPSEQLSDALSLLWEKKFLGLNLTLPHKVQAVELIQQIAPEAAAMGAVNTLKRLREGGYTGDNTDGYGIEQALRRSLGVELEDSDIILIGAGGAARATAFHSLFCGCRSLTIGNRNPERLESLLRLLREHGFDDRVAGFPLETNNTPMSDIFKLKAPVLINATSLGLKAEDPAPIDLYPYRNTGMRVYDMTYGVESVLARQCSELGLPYADGLSMLVWQGVRSLEIWSGSTVPAQAMMSAACHAKGFEAREA